MIIKAKHYIENSICIVKFRKYSFFPLSILLSIDEQNIYSKVKSEIESFIQSFFNEH